MSAVEPIIYLQFNILIACTSASKKVSSNELKISPQIFHIFIEPQEPLMNV